MMSLVMGMRLAVYQLARPMSMVASALAITVVAAASLLERSISVLSAADHALAGATFGIALPLLAFATLERIAGASRLETAVASLARHGAHRRWTMLGSILVAAAALAIAGVVLAALAVGLARGPSDPELGQDLFVSSMIGVVAGIAYAAWFALASNLGRRGQGRVWALGLDWLLGAGTSAIAVPWPRAHIRTLLGAPPVLQMPASFAWIMLAALAISYALLALARTRS